MALHISDRALSAVRVLLGHLGRQLGWSWQPWHLYPSADLARLEAALHAGRGYARRLAKAAVKAGQLGLPGVH